MIHALLFRGGAGCDVGALALKGEWGEGRTPSPTAFLVRMPGPGGHTYAELRMTPVGFDPALWGAESAEASAPPWRPTEWLSLAEDPGVGLAGGTSEGIAAGGPGDYHPQEAMDCESWIQFRVQGVDRPITC